LILHHHESFDGTGYPDGLKGDQIPLMSRILAVADTYDAMTSDRPYRSAMSKADAIEELQRCVGTNFDPVVVETFLKVLDERASDAALAETQPVT
jgi:HD-GYP domain-containing protein (c-di-GMP phosphodiesterase class II)